MQSVNAALERGEGMQTTKVVALLGIGEGSEGSEGSPPVAEVVTERKVSLA